MSRHLPHRLNSIHHAVSIALVYSVSAVALLPAAQAATIGKTIVTSAQHEPLVASITVTDISAKDFVASLANSTVYQQMGLTPTASMSVRFVPTSATTGQVLINTSQPVSMPFADVVLAINDNGQRNVIPKTLLMPLGNTASVKSSNRVIAGAQRPNLPVVSDRVSKPLTVRRGAPPPLFATPSVNQSLTNPVGTQESIQAQTSLQRSASKSNPSSMLPTVSSRTSPALPTLQSSITQSLNVAPTQTNTPQIMKPTDTTANQVMNDSSEYNSALNKTESTSTAINTEKTERASVNSNPSANSTNNTISNNKNIIAQDSSASASGVMNKQFDILNIQITRQIQAKNRTIMSPPIPFINSIDNGNASTDAIIATDTATQNSPSAAIAPESQAPVAQQGVNTNAQLSTTATLPSNALPANDSGLMTSYTVQRNDNLWIISQQIAEKNNLDVQTVMAEIKAQNPEAFIEKNADLLKANAELNLPSYDVVPSQQSLQTAIAAQRQYYSQSNQSVAQKADKIKPKMPASVSDKQTTVAKSARSESAQISSSSNKPTKTTTQTLPQARFSVVAPGIAGSADGTQAKAAAATGNGLSTDILATLKSSRQLTAAQAKRVKTTNSTLSSYATKLQLQNQKLAELEARLKQLRNQ